MSYFSFYDIYYERYKLAFLFLLVHLPAAILTYNLFITHPPGIYEINPLIVQLMQYFHPAIVIIITTLMGLMYMLIWMWAIFKSNMIKNYKHRQFFFFCLLMLFIVFIGLDSLNDIVVFYG